MKTYEDFLAFLEAYLNPLSDFIPVTDEDYYPICFALGRFLLSEPYRWEQFKEQWPKLPEAPKPSKSELIDFFKTNKGLPLSFRKELMENNHEVLYKAYDLLYPIMVSKDEFLTSIFRIDIRSRRFKKLFRESDTKIKRIIAKINDLKKRPGFHQFMQRFTQDLCGFSITLINNKKLLDQVVKKLMK